MTRKSPYTVIRGGKLLDTARRRAVPTDILIKGDIIATIGKPGLQAPAGAAVVDARNRLMHPGLINAHTHGPGNLSKGLHDRWTLELLLTANQWVGIDRNLEDKYLSAKIGAAEMVLKCSTAAYDLARDTTSACIRTWPSRKSRSWRATSAMAPPSPPTWTSWAW